MFIFVSCESEEDKVIRQSLVGNWVYQPNARYIEQEKGFFEKLWDKIDSHRIAESTDDSTILVKISSDFEDFIYDYYNCFQIYDDNTFDYLNGFIDWAGNGDDLGTKSKYKICNGKIKLYDRGIREYMPAQFGNTTDTLFIDGSCYIRLPEEPVFDNIILSRPDHWRRHKGMRLDKEGKMYCYERGEYISITEEDPIYFLLANYHFSQILYQYNSDLKYEGHVYDHSYFDALFIKNDSVLFAVCGYEESAPNKYYYTCESAFSLIENIKLNKIENHFTLNEVRFYDGDLTCFLSDAYSLYLTSELYYNLQPTDVEFEPKYSFGYIKTDGRYYQYEAKEKNVVSDLGYNFVDRHFDKKRWNCWKIE